MACGTCDKKRAATTTKTNTSIKTIPVAPNNRTKKTYTSSTGKKFRPVKKSVR